MHITFVDRSHSFNGHSAALRPLGGAERALIGLSSALAALGHEVCVYNLTEQEVDIAGVGWRKLDRLAEGLPTDLLVAWRKASLLTLPIVAKRRVLWWNAPVDALDRPLAAGFSSRALLAACRADILFQGAAHRADSQFGSETRSFILPPASAAEFLKPRDGSIPPPVAIVTTHPRHGLGWLIDLWLERIAPRIEGAELHLYSASLNDPSIEDEAIRALAATIALSGAAIRILAPRPDAEMAEAYHRARLHLYPGHAEDIGCFTLQDSQACGLPAVARPLGGVFDRINDGSSGYIVPDEAAFANLAVLILENDAVFQSLSAQAQTAQAGHDWRKTAQDFMAMMQP